MARCLPLQGSKENPPKKTIVWTQWTSVIINVNRFADAKLRKQNSQTGGVSAQHGTNVIDSVSMTNPVLTDTSCTAPITATSSSLSPVHSGFCECRSSILTFTFSTLHGYFTTGGPHSVPWHSSAITCHILRSTFRKIRKILTALCCCDMTTSGRLIHISHVTLMKTTLN